MNIGAGSKSPGLNFCRRRESRHWAFTAYLLGLFLLAVAPAAAPAQDYPARPIRLIITTPAGGLVDVIGRLFAEELSARLGQPIVIDNRPGGMTQIGADALNRAAPDGYTLMIATSEAAMLPFL